MRISKAVLQAAVLLTATFCAGQVLAQQWPTRPIRVIVPFDAGGGTDVVIRYYATQLGKVLGQSVYIENDGGAAGAIGLNKEIAAPADGYTLVGTQITNIVALPYLAKLSFDPVKDLIPIVRLATPQELIAVSSGAGINTLQELIARAKKAPGSIGYASSGIGSAPQYRFEELKYAAGIDLLHVPYKGGASMVPDVIANRVQLIADGSLAASLSKGGKVKVLTVLDNVKSPEFPNVPLVNTILPTYKTPASWYLFLAPTGTPAVAVASIKTAVEKISAMPETAKFLTTVQSRPLQDKPDFDLRREVQDLYVAFGQDNKRLKIQ